MWTVPLLRLETVARPRVGVAQIRQLARLCTILRWPGLLFGAIAGIVVPPPATVLLVLLLVWVAAYNSCGINMIPRDSDGSIVRIVRGLRPDPCGIAHVGRGRRDRAGRRGRRWERIVRRAGCRPGGKRRPGTGCRGKWGPGGPPVAPGAGGPPPRVRGLLQRDDCQPAAPERKHDQNPCGKPVDTAQRP